MLIRQQFWLPMIAILGTIILEVWSINAGRLINFDGILYLRSADAFINQDYAKAYAIYSWPLYSAMIAMVSQFFSLSLATAAYTLNGLLQIILTLTFVDLLKKLGGNRRSQWFALAIILCMPYLNDYRSFIMRDFGYWAFFLLGISCFISSVTKQQSGFALLGTLVLLLATAFRIEGLVFVLLLPLTFLFIRPFSLSKRLKFFAMAWIPLILSGIGIIGIAYVYGNANLRSVGRMDHVLNLAYAIPSIRGNVSNIILEMKASVLDYQAQHGASVIVIGGLLVLMLFEIIKVTNPFLFLVSLYSAKRHFMPRSYGKRLCKVALLINLCILLYFVGTFTFLSGRYVVPISLLILLWAPFTIEHMYQYFCVSQSNRIKYWLYPATMFILVGFLGYHLAHWHYDKTYIRDAGSWTKRHISNEQSVFSNNAEYLFYSRGVIKDWDNVFYTDPEHMLAHATKNDRVAIKLSKKQALKILPTLQNWKFLATFQNKHGERLIIMQKT